MRSRTTRRRRRRPRRLIRYYDHEFPVAPGTGSSDLGIRALLDAQNFELRFWQDEAADLNYRRFFAVTTLAGVRVERPEVFEATHARSCAGCARVWPTACAWITPTGSSTPAGTSTASRPP